VASWRSDWRLGGKILRALLIGWLIGLHGVAAADDGAEAVRQLDEVWQSQARDGALADVIERGAAALALDGQNFDLAWRMARASRTLAAQQHDGEARRRFAADGMRWAERAIELRPDRVEGYFYSMLSVGEYGETLSVGRALLAGIGGKFERAGLKAYELDRDFEDGDVMTALGRFYFVLPWPRKDLEKSRRFLEEAVERHPDMLMSSVFLAELHYENGEKKLARALLERVQSTVSSDGREEQQAEARALAREKLGKWFPAE
jgi:hypothetical protein